MPHATRLCALGLIAACATPAGSTSTSGTATTSSTATSFAQAGTPAALVAASTSGALIADDGPPISLTASDGTGLVLTRLEAKAVVEGPLAFTELHLRFQNPQDRVLEGRFAITLPDGAALSRFAMRQDQGWMEAEVVERMAARRAYEDFLHRRQDPALLENEAGNEFSARVFPIPARGTKELIVSFSHEVQGTYTLPLRGLPQVGEVAASVRIARPDRVSPKYDEMTLAQAAWQPDRDFTVSLGGAPRAIRAGELVAATIDPLAEAAPAAIGGVTFLFDTSASRAPGFAGQVENLIATIGELARTHGDKLPVTIAAFDQSVEEVYRGTAGGAAAARDKLFARRPLGASDTAGALRWAAANAPARRVVLVGDAVATVGDDAALGAALAALKPHVDRVDVVLVGGIRDRDAAIRLTRGAFRDDGAILDGARGPAEVARRLGLATRSGVKISVEGARWVWPETLDGVQPGDATVVIAALAAEAGARVQVKAGDVVATVAPVPVTRPLLARAAAGAEIARLQRARDAAPDAAKRSELAKQIVGLSTRHRVVSDLTALLVLETEADYVRFGIPRNALSDIMVVGSGGIALEHRGDAVLIAKPPVEPAPDATGKKDPAKKAKLRDTRDGYFDAGQGQADEGKEADKNAELEEESDEDGAPDGDDRGGRRRAGDRVVTETTVRVEGRVARPSTIVVDQERSGGGDNQERSGGGGGAPADRAPGRDRSDRLAARLESPPPERRPEPPRPSSPSPRRRVLEPEEVGVEGGVVGGVAGGEVSQGIAADRSVALAPPAPPPDEDPMPKKGPPPLEGELGAVVALISSGKRDEALTRALAWRDRDAGDVLALVALGEALEAKQMPALAARAYGSIIDLFPSRADLRRFAGERLERLGDTSRALATDTYRAAVESRPDHLTGHRLLAWSLVRAGDLPGAFAALERGLGQSYPSDRFRGGTRILAEDLGIVAAAWIAKAPREKAAIEARVVKAGGRVSRDASLRFVLYWETDANDVDFHIRDARGGHAFYQKKTLRSGGELYEDVTTGYGPECFTIPGGGRAAPYDLQIHYYSRGPMGYGMGLLEIIRHDGKGNLGFEHRPYIVMIDGAYVDLGRVDAETARVAAGPAIAR